MTKLSLITFTAVPHHSAESIHMVMTAMELAKVCDFELITPAKIWRPQTFSKNLSIYDVDSKKIRHKKNIQFYPNDTSFLFLHSLKEKKDIYCRQGIVADFFLKRNHEVLLELHSFPNSVDLKFLKEAMKTTAFLGLIVITEALKIDILEEIGQGYSNKIYVLPDAADIERFHFKVFNKNNQTLTAGYIGSNFRGKGWEIIEKLPKISKTKFHIYGFSHEKNPYSNMFFYGKIPFSQIPNALDTFDIGLLPNQPSVIVANESEIGKYTSPMKLFEYMASGKVIIASDLPVIREILTDNYNALLVPHDDVEAWSNAIIKLNSSPDLYKRLQQQAYNDVCNLYSYQARAKKILEIVNNCKSK